MKMPKVLALVVSGGLLLLPPVTPLEIFPGAKASIEEKVPSEFLPFSLSQVLHYFNEAFGGQPFRLDERTFVYTDRTNPDETVIITVSQLDTGLAVVLLTTGDYGLNYLREFFEAPFFLRSETEQFYAFLDRGTGVHWMTLDRFTFRLSLSQTGNWLVAALEFGPAQIYRPELAIARPAGSGGAQVDERKPETGRPERASTIAVP